MIALPEFLHQPENKDFWEADGWKPKAKPNAPEKLKRAIEKWVAETEEEINDHPDDEIVTTI